IEGVVPRRRAGDMLGRRWIGNFGATIIGIGVTRLVFPIASVEWSLVCRSHGWGLFNHGAFPAWMTYGGTILMMDLATYVQHFLYHRFDLFWRIHRTHHTDQEYDFSTSVRFHPFEMILDTATVMAVIGLIGAPAGAVFLGQLIVISVNFLE